MRKHFFGLAALFCFTSILFFSCGNVANGTVSIDQVAASENSLRVVVQNYDEVIDQVVQRTSDSRTIVAEQYNTGDTLSFYIWGDSSDGSTMNPKKVNITADAVNTSIGTVDLTGIESRDWYLTLAVCNTVTIETPDKSAVLQDAVLIGYANVDMQYGKEATFVLTSEGLTKTGNVDLSIFTTGWQTSAFTSPANFATSYTASIAIYDRVTGAIVRDSDDASTLVTFNGSTYLSDDEDDPTSYIKSLKPGTYIFQVNFTKKADTSINFAYHDTLIIIPGKEIEADIAVPNVIGTLPAAPTSVTATYKEEHADFYENYFAAWMKWTVASHNETGFEVEVAELDSANKTAITTPTDDTTWTAAISGPSSGSAYSPARVSKYNASNYFGGKTYFPKVETTSLLATNSEVYLKLELGKRYLLRIRAVNSAGESAWVYPTLPSTATAPELTFKSTTVNLYRITYHLQQGLYYAEGSDTTDPSTDNIIVYSSQNTDEQLIYSAEFDTTATTPAPTTTNPTLVKKAGSLTNPVYIKWASWKTGDGNQFTTLSTVGSSPATAESPDDPTTWFYKGFENLDLYAIYGTASGDFIIVDPSSYKIKGSWLKVGTASLTDTTTSKEIVKGATSVSLTVPTDADTDTWIYDTVEIRIENGGSVAASFIGKGAARGTANTLNANLATGTYFVSVTGKYGSSINSYQFVLNVFNTIP